MTQRALVCRCEDVTQKDIEAAFSLGHRDVEEVKRYTGFGTGPCEGKECLALVSRLLAQLGQNTLRPFTARSPVAPVSLRALAGISDLASIPPTDTTLEPSLLGSSKEPLPAQADVVIAGGGIMGLATAYELARAGQRNVVVLEKNYVNYGASGRNGGGVRLQWSTETNIRLMQESMAICRQFASDMGVNVWLRRGGYLFLARNAREQAALEASMALQNRCGVRTQLLAPKQIPKLVPQIDTQGIVAASYNPDDAIIFPWPFLWGYARRSSELGVQVHTFAPVSGVQRNAQGVTAVDTPRGTIKTNVLVAAAGAWSPTLARMAGIELPSWPHRHEIGSTEPLKPWLGPLVAEIGSGLYFSQSMRGEIVAGIALPDLDQNEAEADPSQRRVCLASRLLFLRELAQALLRVVPVLGEVKMLRQWAGPYDMTPDGHPLLGEHPACPGLWFCSGFVGHGFMMAPAVARHIAAALTGRPRHAIFDQWRVDRFSAGGPKLMAEALDIG